MGMTVSRDSELNVSIDEGYDFILRKTLRNTLPLF